LDWARQQCQLRKQPNEIGPEPFVVGAVIDPGFCLDLISSNGIQALEDIYSNFQMVIAASDVEMPKNVGGEDLLLRKLDCAVINYFHKVRKIREQPTFDTVRGVFTEGERIYPNSGFRRKTHIQICVINPDVIKGVFRVPESHFTQA